MTRRHRPGKLAICLAAAALGALSGCPSESGNGQAFNAARDLMMRGEYEEAAAGFERFLQQHPGDRLASRASFCWAKCHIGRGDLAAARARFEATRRDFRGSEEAHKAAYKLAVIAFWDGDRETALSLFRGLAERPAGVLAPESAAMVRFLAAEEGPP